MAKKSQCGAWCWSCNKDDMWDHTTCPDCGEPIAIRHTHRCRCGPERLSITRTKPVYCPWCEETKAEHQDPAWYPEWIDWQVCAECQSKEESMLDGVDAEVDYDLAAWSEGLVCDGD